jgi:hypothetical protein
MGGGDYIPHAASAASARHQRQYCNVVHERHHNRIDRRSRPDTDELDGAIGQR